MKVLANDGISKSGADKLIKNGFDIITVSVEQGQLINYINKNDVVVLLVRSATKVRKDIIDSCPGLKIIGRGGVGMDNIDVDYAREKGLKVINTPASSSLSVAELFLLIYIAVFDFYIFQIEICHLRVILISKV